MKYLRMKSLSHQWTQKLCNKKHGCEGLPENLSSWHLPSALLYLGGYQSKFSVPPRRVHWLRSTGEWNLKPDQAEAGNTHASLQLGGCLRQTSIHLGNFQITQRCSWNIQVPPGLEESRTCSDAIQDLGTKLLLCTNYSLISKSTGMGVFPPGFSIRRS